MPGFADNLRRALEAANLSSADLANRLGDAPLWLTHLEAIDAALPELPHLMRVAQALNCRVDDLLAGRDEDYDHPRRRHAALLAARLGRARALMERVAVARQRSQLTALDERAIDEPALLSTVTRCRAWVTAADAPLALAGDLEHALDVHVDRIEGTLARAIERWERGSQPTARPAARVGGPALSIVAPAPPAAAPTTVPKRPPRPAGHLTTLWSRPGPDDEVACEMFARTQEVEVRVVHGEVVLGSRLCANLNDALSQSGAWRRLPDADLLALASRSDPPASPDPAGVGPPVAEPLPPLPAGHRPLSQSRR